MPQFPSKTLIALGSNVSVGENGPKDVIVAAIDAMLAHGLLIRVQSTIYRTPAFPALSGPDFANAAVAIDTSCTPDELLQILHKIEADFGRTRQSRWTERTLDLDLLAVGDAVLPNRTTLDRWIALPPELQLQATPRELLLPHPRLQDRAFVLVPLCEVAPDWMHPVLGRTVAQMCDALPAYLKEDVIKYQ